MGIFSSCAIPVAPGDLGNKDLDYYYQTSGAVEFFLPQLPSWANTSRSAGCFRKEAVRYFDFYKLHGSYNYSYEQLINFQHSFNVEQQELTLLFGKHAHSLSEEEKLFYKISDKVQAGHVSFDPPSYSVINLVWIDHLLKHGPEKGGQKMQALFNHGSIAGGHPIWFSLCLSNGEMVQWLKDTKVEGLNAKWITSEFFAPFSSDMARDVELQLDVEKYFGSKKTLNIFVPEGQNKPLEIKGKINLKKLPF